MPYMPEEAQEMRRDQTELHRLHKESTTLQLAQSPFFRLSLSSRL